MTAEEGATKELEKTKKNLASKTIQLKEAKEKLKALSTEKENNQFDIEAKDQQITILVEECELLKKNLQKEQQKYNSLKEESQKSPKPKYASNQPNYSHQLFEQEKLILSIQEEQTKEINELHDEYQVQLDELEDKVEKYKEKCKLLKEEKDMLQNILTTKKEELSEAMNANSDLQMEMSKMAKDYEQNYNREADEKIAYLEKEVKELRLKLIQVQQQKSTNKELTEGE